MQVSFCQWTCIPKRAWFPHLVYIFLYERKFQYQTRNLFLETSWIFRWLWHRCDVCFLHKPRTSVPKVHDYPLRAFFRWLPFTNGLISCWSSPVLQRTTLSSRNEVRCLRNSDIPLNVTCLLSPKTIVLWGQECPFPDAIDCSLMLFLFCNRYVCHAAIMFLPPKFCFPPTEGCSQGASRQQFYNKAQVSIPRRRTFPSAGWVLLVWQTIDMAATCLHRKCLHCIQSKFVWIPHMDVPELVWLSRGWYWARSRSVLESVLDLLQVLRSNISSYAFKTSERSTCAAPTHHFGQSLEAKRDAKRLNSGFGHVVKEKINEYLSHARFLQ